MASTNCKLTFNVNCRSLGAGEALHVCVLEGASTQFDPSSCIPLVRTEEPLDSTPKVGPAAELFSVWSTPKPLNVPWGVQLRYKYAIFTNGAFASWEKLSGDGTRSVTISGKVRCAALRLRQRAQHGLTLPRDVSAWHICDLSLSQ